jgi:hypothetical protein
MIDYHFLPEILQYLPGQNLGGKFLKVVIGMDAPERMLEGKTGSKIWANGYLP